MQIMPLLIKFTKSLVWRNFSLNRCMLLKLSIEERMFLFKLANRDLDVTWLL